MEILIVLLMGAMFTAGFYLLLQRRLAQLIVGLGLMTNATNLLVFTVAGLSRDGAPLVEDGADTLPVAAADPIPQALVLTAIVIGFGVLAFFITLAYRAYREVGSDNLDEMTTTDLLRSSDDASTPGADGEEAKGSL